MPVLKNIDWRRFYREFLVGSRGWKQVRSQEQLRDTLEQMPPAEKYLLARCITPGGFYQTMTLIGIGTDFKFKTLPDGPFVVKSGQVDVLYEPLFYIDRAGIPWDMGREPGKTNGNATTGA